MNHFRNLIWALNSPPLLASSCALAQINYPSLCATDADLNRIESALASSLSELSMALSRHTRLGKYFEDIIWLALTHHPRWRGIARNTVITGKDRTLGELDLLVLDRLDGHLEHWELAVKFFLGVGDLSTTGHWIGPRQTDRLDKKIKKLGEVQLPLGQRYFEKQNVAVKSSHALIKGRLFYPLSEQHALVPFLHPEHDRSVWASAAQWRETLHSTGVQHVADMSRLHWLCPLETTAPATPFSTMLETYDHVNGEATALWHVERHQMIFVVSDSWVKASVNFPKTDR